MPELKCAASWLSRSALPCIFRYLLGRFFLFGQLGFGNQEKETSSESGAKRGGGKGGGNPKVVRIEAGEKEASSESGAKRGGGMGGGRPLERNRISIVKASNILLYTHT